MQPQELPAATGRARSRAADAVLANDQLPRQRNAIAVGVTGHRPPRLHDADLAVLQERVREVLGTIAGAADAEVIVISPLAEGADRIVAGIALDSGWRLHCVLPFPRDEYARDFRTVSSRAEYAVLLSRATTVTELTGSRARPEESDAAYTAAGVYTVQHADVMIAIWDGETARGRGGTGDVVALSLQCGVPVVWISSERPHAVSVLAGPIEEQPLPCDARSIAAALQRRGLHATRHSDD